MKRNRNNSIIAVIVTAVIAIVCGVFAFTAGTRKTNSGDFSGAYSLTAYADTGITKINVLGKEVDVLKFDPLTSIDGNYQLYITVIDTADLIGLDVNLGYGFGEKVFSDLEKEGLTNVVYSSLTSGEEKLTIDEVVEGFGLTNNGFDRPFFAIVEVAKTSILDKIGELVFAEKHTVELVEGKASTCTEDGYKAYYTCTDAECTKNFADKYAIKEITDLDVWKAGDGKIVATGHTEVTDEAVAATCTATGLTEGKHCSVCGTITVAQTVVEATGHTEVTDEAVEATCTQTGLTEGKHCSVCGAVTVAQTEVPATGHTEVVDEAVEANCTESGLTEGKHCSVCGAVTVAQTEIPATGHTEVIDNAVAATCTQSGLTEGKHCSVCGTVTVAQTVVEATGHTEVTDEAVEATCTQTGLTEGKHCSVCNTILTAQTEIPAKGHTYLDNYEDEYCTVCHEHNTIVKDVNGVNYTLNYNINSETGEISRYFVATGKGADFNTAYYANEANTLVLENVIDGYPVTEIAANAFANYLLDENGEVVIDSEGNPETGTTNTSIKNIVVPENIGFVGEHAFLDNYNIKSAAFLANEVVFDGMAGKTHTMPFYGCSTADGGNTTRITVYHHTITTKNSGQNWDQFRWNGSRGFIIKDAGGTLYANGSWSMVGTTISGADIVTECNFADVVNANVTTGLVNEYYTQSQGDAIKIKLEEALSGYTSNGANKYVVNVTVTNTSNSIATVAITVSLNVPVEVKVNSAVAFSYSLENQSFSAGSTTMKVVKSGDNVILYDPVATDTTYNYTFLGWAKEVNGALKFIGSTTEYNAETVYYAIWGASQVKTAFSASTHRDGSTLVNPTGEGIDGNWYDKNWNKLTEISTANTVVYTRTKFAMTVSLNRGGYDTNRVFILKDSVQILNEKISGHGLPGKKTTEVTTIDIYEGNITFNITDNELTISTDKVTYIIYVKEINWKGNDANKRGISFHSDSGVNADTKEITGNLTLVLGY